MIILECEQRSVEWYAARCGVPTASNFDCIVTSKGEPSKQRQKYLYKVAGEAITGIPEDLYTNSAMLRGQELESEARAYYEFVNDVEVKQVGFCKSEFGGASPDGLIGDEGGLEIKCPSIAVHVGYLMENKLPTEYIQQVQGELLITGRKWWDFVSYYPGLSPLILRVEPDTAFMAKLSAELISFNTELQDVIKRIR